MTSKWKWISIGLAWLVMVGLGMTYKDPDFGWHYTLGGVIAKSGFPKTDPFSYAMASYPFVDYEWGTNVLWYFLYPTIGQLGLVMIYATILIASGLVIVPTKYKRYGMAPVWLYWAAAITMFGVRPQVVSWLFMALLLRGVWDEEWRDKWGGMLPALMLLWVNIHGSYPLGGMILGLWLGIRLVWYRKAEVKYWLWYLGGFVATLVNPYGVKDWFEIVMQINQSGFFAKTILEWYPFWYKPDVGVIAALAVTIFGIVKFWRKLKLENAAIMLLLIEMGMSHLRHVPFLMIGVAAWIAMVFEEVAIIARKNKLGEQRMGKFYKIWLIMTLIIFGLNGLLSGVNMYRFGHGFFPEKAVNYIQNNGVPQRMFSTYGWGGYLIWKLPGQRVFADGRMSGFSWKAPPGESDQAFEEFLAITSDLDKLGPALDKYKVNSVLWEKSSVVSSFWGGEQNWLQKLLKLPKDSNETVPERLAKLGWRQVFEDDLSVIYIRNF